MSRFGPTLPFQPSAAFIVWHDAHGRFAVNASVRRALDGGAGGLRAVPGEAEEQDGHRAGEADRDRAAGEPPLARAVDERHADQDDHERRRDDDRREQQQVRVLEQPQQLEQEEEVPLGARVVALDRGVGAVLVQRAEHAALAAVVDVDPVRRGEVPEAREPDDQEDEEAVRDDVVEQRVREEALPRPLLVAVLAQVPLAALAGGQPRHVASSSACRVTGTPRRNRARRTRRSACATTAER